MFTNSWQGMYLIAVYISFSHLYCFYCGNCQQNYLQCMPLFISPRPLLHYLRRLGYVYMGPNWNSSKPNQTRLVSVYMEPFGTDLVQIQNWRAVVLQVQFLICLDPFRTGSRTVPRKWKAYLVRFSDRIHLEPVLCKQSLNDISCFFDCFNLLNLT